MIDRQKLLSDLQSLLRTVEGDLRARSEDAELPEVSSWLKAEYESAKEAGNLGHGTQLPPSGSFVGATELRIVAGPSARGIAALLKQFHHVVLLSQMLHGDQRGPEGLGRVTEKRRQGGILRAFNVNLQCINPPYPRLPKDFQ